MATQVCRSLAAHANLAGRREQVCGPGEQLLLAVHDRQEDLRGQVEENLRQLGRDHLDLVYLRIGEGLERGTGSLAERFGVLAELRQAGLIAALSISNVSAEHLTEALSVAPVVSVQNQYGLSTRRDDDAGRTTP